MFSQKKIDLLILLDLHVSKVRIQKKWILGVDMFVCLSVCLCHEYLENYWADLDHILDLAVF